MKILVFHGLKIFKLKVLWYPVKQFAVRKLIFSGSKDTAHSGYTAMVVTKIRNKTINNISPYSNHYV